MKGIGIWVALLAACISLHALGCTNLLIGAAATADGSTYITYSCDNGGYGAVRMLKEHHHPVGALLTIYENPPLFPVENPALTPSIPSNLYSRLAAME